MAGFEKMWNRPAQPGLGQKVGTLVKPQGALKPRVQAAITRIQKQGAKLDAMLAKLRERDANVFTQVVEATQRHDTHGARILSSELTEIRKVSRVLGNARMALQKVELRLTTAHDVGDTLVAIMPTIGVMNGMKSSLAKFMPGADQEIARMSEVLGGMMGESFAETDGGPDAAMTEESKQILDEAAAVAQAGSDTKFPTMPGDAGETGSETPSSSKFF